MRKILILIILSVFVPQSTIASTIYLKDKTKIEGTITAESETEFRIQKKGDVTYTAFYREDVIKKANVFCVIDDKGELRYPRQLTLMVPSPSDSLSNKVLSDREFQGVLLQQQYESQKEINAHLNGIETIMVAEFALMIIGIAATGIAALSK
jgi:hypothetical protein